MKPEDLRLLVAVGSRRDKVCSIGAFARAEAKAMEKAFKSVELLEPTAEGVYPDVKAVEYRPDVVLYHAPSLYDRGKPFSAIRNALILKKAFGKALFVPVVHEYSEAPRHWRLRQLALLRLAHGAIVNTEPELRALRRWHPRVVKIHLGPTLVVPELFAGGSRQARAALLMAMRAQARAELLRDHAATYGLGEREKWLLHPGLLVPGKGLNFLGKLESKLPKNGRLVVMGGPGPTESDREFAHRTLAELRERLQGRLSFVESPSDPLFRSFLLAADLVVLPYDAGLSERRSSFLSAMSCGANVWTTTGQFTPPMELNMSGAHAVPVEQWASESPEALCSVADALSESDEETLTRRLRNVAWASGWSWSDRVEKAAGFISLLR